MSADEHRRRAAGHAEISDRELCDLLPLLDSGRSIPAVVVRALVERLRIMEGREDFGCERSDHPVLPSLF